MIDHDELADFVDERIKKSQDECPYWADGKHCFVISSPPLGRYDPRSLPKLCYCGAKVMPRDGVFSAEG